MSELARLVYSDDSLCHYQVKGAKWGVRRWQYPDGSLTPEGRIHYGIGPARNKDSDMEDPLTYAYGDVARLKDIKKYRDEASEDIRRDNLKLQRKRNLFESKKHYDVEMEINRSRKKAANAEYERRSAEYDEVLKVAQARYEKYHEVIEELLSDRDWINNYMLQQTGVEGSEQTTADEREMSKKYEALEDAVKVYYYSGLFNVESALEKRFNANIHFERNDGPRGQAAAVQTATKHVLKNKKESIDSKRFVRQLNLELNSVHTSAIANTIHLHGDLDKAEKMAEELATKMVGDYGNTRLSDNVTVKQAVKTYLYEKAETEAHGFRDNAGLYEYYDPSKDKQWRHWFPDEWR